MLPFQKFDKIPRLSRDIVITEKIDGTNAQIFIGSVNNLREELSCNSYNDFFEQHILAEIKKDITYYIFAGSKTRWLDTSSDGDNFGFAKYVQANAEELFSLGEGRHYGEWYGKGIQRNYELDEKRFALFNVKKWIDKYDSIRKLENDKQQYAPSCCRVVPILYEGMFDTREIEIKLQFLKDWGSVMVPSFMNPEGIIIYHKASGQLFKKTVENDEKPKG